MKAFWNVVNNYCDAHDLEVIFVRDWRHDVDPDPASFVNDTKPHDRCMWAIIKFRWGDRQLRAEIAQADPQDREEPEAYESRIAKRIVNAMVKARKQHMGRIAPKLHPVAMIV